MPRAFTAFMYLLAATAPLAAQSQVTVTNAATFLDRLGVAPGGLASLFGDFSGFSLTVADGPHWQTQLGGLEVLVNGVPSPIYAVVPASASNSGQINFQVPAGAAGGTVQVKLNGQVVGQGTMTVNTVSPGIFLLDYSSLQGAILNQDFSVNSISSRAKRGDVIQIYGTGQGGLQTPVTDGYAPSTYALSALTPKVYIGDVETSVQFSGVVGYPGFWQVNAVVPDRPFITGPTPLVLVLNGVQSNHSTFWVVE
jgi:uncharacterized protein (TIGR03437 family)